LLHGQQKNKALSVVMVVVVSWGLLFYTRQLASQFFWLVNQDWEMLSADPGRFPLVDQVHQWDDIVAPFTIKTFRFIVHFFLL